MVRPALAAPLAIVGLSLAFAASPALAADGGQLFAMQCKMCHQAASSVMAPSLAGVAGSKMASKADFTYSAGLKAKGDTWTDANLDSFLKAPSGFVPGTKMVVSVLSDENRAAIIDYLHTLK